jgi:hypothetical protein
MIVVMPINFPAMLHQAEVSFLIDGSPKDARAAAHTRNGFQPIDKAGTPSLSENVVYRHWAGVSNQ